MGQAPADPAAEAAEREASERASASVARWVGRPLGSLLAFFGLAAGFGALIAGSFHWAIVGLTVGCWGLAMRAVGRQARRDGMLAGNAG
ncbi:MAG: hypothetical protein AAF533_26925 [Acidobacteriota bacterium]